MIKNSWIELARYVGVGALVILAVGVLGRLRLAQGTWYVHSAPLPESWPVPTPVDEVEVKQYPTYRVAVVEEPSAPEDGKGSMFMELFRHIQDNDISMTAPVELGYEPGGGPTRLSSMAFLYREPELGEVGEQGAVRVEDVAPRTFASVGVRGDYSDENLDHGRTLLAAWLEANAESWEAAGPARYLGYNGPFVPKFMRYGEVQVPVERR